MMKINNKDPLVFVAAVIAAQVISGLVTQMSPLVVGGISVGMNLTELQAGYVVFAEIFVLSMTVIVVAPFLSNIPYRSLCFGAAGIAIGAQFISLFISGLYMFVAARCIAGVGEGIIYAVSLAAVATHSNNPDKLYGYFQVVWALSSIVLFALGGNLIDSYGHLGIYGMITAIAIPLVFFLRWLPNDRISKQEETYSTDLAAPNYMGILTLAGIFLYVAASAAIYTFTAPFGLRSGLSSTQIGYALTASSVFGVGGAALATWLNVRKGRVFPITAFSIAFSFTAIIMSTNTDFYVFCIALTLIALLYYFSIPYLFGLAAALDKTGRWAAAAGSAFLLGFSVGPAFAGTMIEYFDYDGLGISAVVVTVFAWLLLVFVARRLDSSVQLQE